MHVCECERNINNNNAYLRICIEIYIHKSKIFIYSTFFFWKMVGFLWLRMHALQIKSEVDPQSNIRIKIILKYYLAYEYACVSVFVWVRTEPLIIWISPVNRLTFIHNL